MKLVDMQAWMKVLTEARNCIAQIECIDDWVYKRELFHAREAINSVVEDMETINQNAIDEIEI